MQSGKAVGRFRTHPDAPRVLIANSNLVPKWATWDEFRRLEAMGLTMFGQMTAGSWIYIGTQGILQGTYETFVAARKAYAERTKKRRGRRWVLTAGLGGMGGAQPLAATMAGMSCLAVEVDPSRIEKRLATRYVDVRSRRPRRGARAHRGGAQGGARRSASRSARNAAEVYPELVRRKIVPDLVTEQTAAHDPLNGYIPLGLSLEEAAELRAEDPAGYVERAKASMAEEVERDALDEGARRRGLRLRQQHPRVREGSRAASARSTSRASCRRTSGRSSASGKGPFRWVALSGDPADIAATDDAVLAAVPDDPDLRRWIDARARAREVPGPAVAHLLARLRRPREGRPRLQRARAHAAR